MRQDTKFRILRRTIFAAAVITVFLFQYTASYVSYSFAFPTGLLIPLTVSVAMAEREYAGLCFGLLAGILTDTVSSVTDGVFTLFFAVAACTAGLLAHYIFRNTVLTAMLFTLVTSAAYCAVLLIFNCLIHDASYAPELIKRTYLPSVLLSSALTPIVFVPATAIHNRLRSPDDAVRTDFERTH